MRDIVLSDHLIWRCDSETSFSITHRPDVDFVEQMEWIVGTHQAKNVFIDPSSGWARSWDDIVAAFPKAYRDATKSGYIRNIRPHFNNDGFEYAIINKDDGWAFYRKYMDAEGMARTIGRAAKALGMKHINAVTTSTGMQVMRDQGVNLKVALSEDVGGHINSSKAVSPEFHWSRKLTARELERDNVLSYDANSAYLACAQNLEFGIGEPRKVKGIFHEKDPGFYFVNAKARDSQWTGVTHPNPFSNTPCTTYSGWVAAPAVRFARDNGWHIETPYGYHWPKGERSKALARWATRMWEARCGSAGVVREVIKNCANSAIGRLSRSTEKNLFGLRPDWQQLIVSEARIRRLRYLASMPEYSAFAINLDEIFFATDSEHYPEFELRSDGLGGYKRSGLHEMPDAFNEVLDTRNHGIDVMLVALKKAGTV